MKYLKWFVLAGLIVWAASTAQAQLLMMKNPHIGKPVPEFKVKILSGAETALSDFREGKKAIIFFWATWCPHCRAALKELNRDREAIAQKGIKLVIVDVGESARDVKSYVNKNKIGLEVFLDEEETLSEQFGIIGVPTFFFVNEAGVVKDVQHYLPDDYEAILSAK